MDQLASTESLDDRRTIHLAKEQVGFTADSRTISFGGFRVFPGARALMLHGEAVPLGSRAFDLLLVLLRSRGHVVAKEEIVRAVWPSTFVDESNLRFQMTVLRKALGAEREWIKTIPGRGYLFVAEEEAALPPAFTADLVSSSGETARSALAGSVILIIEPDQDERNEIAMLLRALKVSVLGFSSVDEVAAFAVHPLNLASGYRASSRQSESRNV
jgi:DNA-binding winged helix-turn-helix (wHTH) protein